ncbi:MAG: EutN/CcmL family microcompartment protein [Pseudomonadota bacterium]
MILARVIGTAVATIKHPAYQGRKVLVVQPLTPEGEDSGKSFLAVDAVQAGVGDQVLVAREGNTARQILAAGEAPIHSVVLSVVDEVHLDTPEN